LDLRSTYDVRGYYDTLRDETAKADFKEEIIGARDACYLQNTSANQLNSTYSQERSFKVLYDSDYYEAMEEHIAGDSNENTY
jgi:hypothetical protein